MCGINGFLGHDKALLSKMNDTLKHRGPDYAGSHEEIDWTFGHTLLSIRDSAQPSRQPYRKKDSPWVLLYNGQIYNTKQLVQYLGGNAPTVSLDTELLYRLIEKDGWNFTSKIHGMFAIALYNRAERVLRLYRDPSGQKPLYYYFKNNNFIFSSEIKAILCHKPDGGIDGEAIVMAMKFGFIPGRATVFKYIKKVRPREVVTYKTATQQVDRGIFELPDTRHFFETSDIHRVFTNTVQEHLQSKEKVALNLSGGLDSSILAYEMRKLGHAVTSYTTHFDTKQSRFNRDADLAAQFARDYALDHHRIAVTRQDYLDNFEESFSIIEEPNGNLSAPVYLFTAKAEGIGGDRNRVVLSGDGGDEVFGGYPHYAEVHSIAQKMGFAPWAYNLAKTLRTGVYRDFSDATDLWIYLKSFPDFLLQPPARHALRRYLEDAIDTISPTHSGSHRPIYEVMLRDRILWLAGEHFIRSDKLYMSQSVELRAPFSYSPFRDFFDTQLTEDDYRGKQYLRRIYHDLLPTYITDRPDKSGWRAPLEEWYDHEMKRFFLELLPQSSGKDSLIDWSAVKKAIASTDAWPGKKIHVYLSLAVLSRKFGLNL